MGYDRSWDNQRQTCRHGVREGLDSHDCASCAIIAKETGKDMSGGRTYLYLDDPRLTKPETDHAASS